MFYKNSAKLKLPLNRTVMLPDKDTVMLSEDQSKSRQQVTALSHLSDANVLLSYSFNLCCPVL